MTGPRFPAVLALCGFLVSACGGSVGYLPQEPGRIHFVRNDNKNWLERDGKLYSMSGWSHGPTEAVSGNPAAEAEARSFTRKTWSSLILSAAGLILVVPSAVVWTDEPGHSERRTASIALAASAFVAFIAAMSMPMLARHHLYDAVNIYNDDLASRPPGISPPSPKQDAPVGLPVEPR